MKTILQRCQTLVADNSGPNAALSYVKNTEIVHPDLGMTNITGASIPKIIFTPMLSVERWVASGKKEAMNTVAAYIILAYSERQSSIMGDSTRPAGQGKGIIDFVNDFMTVFRGQRFSVGGTPYLSKPLDIRSIEYFKPNLSDQPDLILAEIIMECPRLFIAVPLPGDV